jgi:hypothetical protein
MDAVRRRARKGWTDALSRVHQWAPIALFIYKRPEHARRAIVGLQACDGAASSPIYVFADGPKSEAELPAVEATRAVARELLGGSAVFVEREANRGLAESIIAGATELCDRHGSIVAVEDDLVVAPSFLRFLNEGLERYRDEPQVMQISGHMFVVPALKDQREAIFLPMTTSWGWATWRRAWNLFEPSAAGWRERLSDAAEARRFNLDGRYDYARMLSRQMTGAVDSWAIRWYYTVFAHHGLVLYPPRTLVSNIGFDATGTHDRLALPANQAPLAAADSFELPTDVVESPLKAHVFEAINAFRPSGTRQRLFALLKGTLRRGPSR